MNEEWTNLLQSQLQFDIIFVLNHTDIDECVEETDNCDDSAICINTDGSFTCLCEPGFSGDGVQCEGKTFFITDQHTKEFYLLPIATVGVKW